MPYNSRLRINVTYEQKDKVKDNREIKVRVYGKRQSPVYVSWK